MDLSEFKAIQGYIVKYSFNTKIKAVGDIPEELRALGAFLEDLGLVSIHSQLVPLLPGSLMLSSGPSGSACMWHTFVHDVEHTYT